MGGMEGGYTIELAASEHLPFLAEIERAAAQLFVGWDVPDSVLGESTALDEFRQVCVLAHTPSCGLRPSV